MLPDCRLMAFPHIDSKMRKWKKQYAVIFDMLNTSSFGWNDVKKCVEVDSDEVWKSYMQDRATGQRAETPNDMVNEVNREEINLDNDNEEDGGYSPISVTQPSSSQHTSRVHSNTLSRKRSRSQDSISVSIEKVATVFQQAYNQSVQSMNMIAEHMLGDKEDISNIANELAAIGLTEDDELEALTLILQKSYNISAFKSLRSERKLAFVRKLLHENKV
ncbi:Myb/SANT-like domain containing protein [Melia azedarach]|uniref:Myb/SANT-like domain containing protein n=1 Tax=Melia azedarach TaxID=155640 RepID=A0ACC1Y8X3_MELAZ|nr:Myb/SANT-like domain containing protein [Melia azedarach]